MSKEAGAYRVVDLPPGRRVWLNTLDASTPAHPIYGLLEADVTTARRLIAEHKARTGETLSFTAFVVFCLARAVSEHPEVQAYLQGRKRIIQYDDVSVGLLIENTAGDRPALMGHIIQHADRKTHRQIHDEIRSVQAMPAPPARGMPRWFRTAMLLPWPLSGLAKRLLGVAVRRDPAIRLSTSGTVFVSAVGMFGKGRAGWGIATSPHSLSVLVGGVSWKPTVVDGRIEPREGVDLTLVFDHDIVDGAPAARFAQRFVELVEGAHGLDSGPTPQRSNTGGTVAASAP